MMGFVSSHGPSGDHVMCNPCWVTLPYARKTMLVDARGCDYTGPWVALKCADWPHYDLQTWVCMICEKHDSPECLGYQPTCNEADNIVVPYDPNILKDVVDPSVTVNIFHTNLNGLSQTFTLDGTGDETVNLSWTTNGVVTILPNVTNTNHET